jgi:DSF synthase
MSSADGNAQSLSRFYDQLNTHFDRDKRILWCYLNPRPRPCFTPGLLEDLKKFLSVTRNLVTTESEAGRPSPIEYLAFGSYHPGIFSLGGDLRLFVDLIRANDHAGLTEYMKLSIDVMHGISVNVGLSLNTVAIIRGNAMGAGFEGALACDAIVAERQVQLGFPEVLFNMFPGMGAYSFLARRIEPTRVKQMILSGRIYTAEELYDMGVIDVLAEEGGAVEAFHSYTQQHEKHRNTYQSLTQIRDRVQPVSYQELLDIGHMWVDAALNLTDRELRTMERLVRAQNRLSHSGKDDDIVETVRRVGDAS